MDHWSDPLNASWFHDTFTFFSGGHFWEARRIKLPMLARCTFSGSDQIHWTCHVVMARPHFSCGNFWRRNKDQFQICIAKWSCVIFSKFCDVPGSRARTRGKHSIIPVEFRIVEFELCQTLQAARMVGRIWLFQSWRFPSVRKKASTSISLFKHAQRAASCDSAVALFLFFPKWSKFFDKQLPHLCGSLWPKFSLALLFRSMRPISLPVMTICVAGGKNVFFMNAELPLRIVFLLRSAQVWRVSIFNIGDVYCLLIST